jgi:hypothetical protein
LRADAQKRQKNEGVAIAAPFSLAGIHHDVDFGVGSCHFHLRHAEFVSG